MIHRLRQITTNETTASAVLLGAALLALVWANSPVGDGYRAVTQAVVGTASLHLDLSVATWAADGLLAVFFLVVGLELKHELVVGSLSKPREAAVPMLAAVGGMVAPAALYLLISDRPHGWAIPTATDIAFAVAVLMVAGRGLPLALRTFLLTLAVVDDLLAIVVIAIFYTETVDLVSLAGALALIGLCGLLAHTSTPRLWLIVPLALAAWWLMHHSGVHATVAGVLLGLSVPAHDGRAERWAERVQPWSAGLALPVFAFCAAGVVVPADELLDVLTSPVAAGVATGLVVGKVVGVLGTTALVTRLTPLRLPQGIGVRDLVGVGLLTGIGFTVSLLVAELSFGEGPDRDAAKAAVLFASLVAATAGTVALRRDARLARSPDMNDDGVPDGELRRIGE
ncbi:MAG: Na+/H+ antiporter NhaA [Aeromicrobium sp.]|uniref:Na+/H+ antiporter NhaA n=1 Tax=Aeromicrobium sp. TaxID=1871063 RepID=UPI0039E5C405